MNARRLSLALSLSLAVSPAFAGDHAQPRSGGGGGGGGAHGSSHSGGGYSSGGASGSGQSSYHAVPRSSSRSSASGAQSRHPRAGTGRYYYGGGRGTYRSYPRYYGYGGYYGGYYAYDPYFYYYGGYAPYYGGYYYNRPYEPAYGYSSAQGALRLLVEPDNTKVYVDGYYSGVVDDYDGLFQRLYLPMGKHQIVLRLDGYETQRLKVYVSPGETLKIHYEMEKGSGDSAKEIVAGDPSMEKYPARLRDDDADDDRAVADDSDDDSAEDAPPAHMAMRQSDRGEAAATLRLTVIPDDASIYVDGRFYGTARDSRRVEVAPGKHRIEAVRPGYRTFEKDVDVADDDSPSLDITLER